MYLDLPQLNTHLLQKHAFTDAPGKNHSPALSWGNIPPGTQSLALIMHDPDAPTGGMGFTHWIIVYMPTHIQSLEEGANTRMPESIIEINNDYGVLGYGGPCPPLGREHRYIFTLYALNTSLEKAYDRLITVPVAQVGFEINACAINTASKCLYYKR